MKTANTPREGNQSVRKRILLVEDERILRETLGRMLAVDDHTVVEANNGAEALSLFAQDQFDLVVTDFQIPFLKGNELATRIKQLAPRQPIIMITGHHRQPGPDLPVDAVLDKPVELNRLRTTMAKLFARAQRGAAGRGDTVVITRERPK
jgi:CheY-like chemotaxis protein